MSLAAPGTPELLEVFTRVADAQRDALSTVVGARRRARTDRPGQYHLDTVADAAILPVLHAAGVRVLSEESAWTGDPDAPVTVVLDPVDGSTNCARNIPYWGISVCAVDADGLMCALVQNGATGATFTAMRGAGSWLGDEPLHASTTRDIDRSVIALATMPDRVLAWRQFRALGSSALALCDVAAGHLDGFLDTTHDTHSPWDYLGGMLVCMEAGALVVDAAGSRSRDRRLRRTTASDCRGHRRAPRGAAWRHRVTTDDFGLDLDALLDAARNAAAVGAEIVRDGFRSARNVREKAPGDLVTDTDTASEAAVRASLSRSAPGIAFFGEESGGERADIGWFVDPLDGTTNFVHGHPAVGVSIGLVAYGEPVVAVVDAPLLGDVYWARSGGGAHRNGEPVRVSERAPAQAVCATGFPFRAKETRLDGYLPVMERALRAFEDLRRVGAASLDLSWTAAGVFDGYFELGLGTWDVAAGALLVREAGGIVTDWAGDDRAWLHSGDIVAGPPQVHRAILELLGM